MQSKRVLAQDLYPSKAFPGYAKQACFQSARKGRSKGVFLGVDLSLLSEHPEGHCGR